MELAKILQNTADEYAAKQVAEIRRMKKEEEDELMWRGKLNDPGGFRPIGLYVVVTPEPATHLNIEEIKTGESKPGAISVGALDALNMVVSDQQGRAGVLWVNAGMPGVIAGNYLANAWRNYQITLDQETAGKSWQEASRKLAWTSAVPVKLFKGRKGTVMDWLAAAVSVDSDAGDPPQSEDS